MPLLAPPRRLPSALLSSLLALGAMACGGSSTTDGQGGRPGTGGGDQGSGGSGATGGGSSGSGGSGGNASGCSQYEDAGEWSIMVQIKNHTSAPLHLGQREVTCGASRPFGVFQHGVLLADFPLCRQSCEAVMQDGPLGCPAICLYPSTITLAPGEATHVEWTGQYAVDVMLPQQCWSKEGNAGISACDRAARIEPGTFTFVAMAGAGLDCSQTSGTCPSCTPKADGGCETQAALVSGEELVAEATVELDAGYGVGYDAGAGAIRNVEIVFGD